MLATAETELFWGLSEDFVMTALLAAAGTLILTVWLIGRTIRDVARSRAEEATKREVAAYVAEGSISPDDAAAILNAGSLRETQKSITDAVAAGIIPPAKAERLIASLRQGPNGPRGV